MAKKFETKDDVLSYVNSLSVQKLIEEYANLLWERELEKEEIKCNKIVITESQFSALQNLFKIRGITETGEVERRGRKRREII